MHILYPDKNVYYFAIDQKNFLGDNQVPCGGKNAIDDKVRAKVRDAYPFAIHATDPIISFLLESNRLNMVDDIIHDINNGVQFE